MKNKQKGFTVPLIIAIVALLAIGGSAYYFFAGKAEKQVVCTKKAKMCPDGSSVSRTGPNCEFMPCSNEEIADINWKTYHNDIYGFELKYPSLWVVRDGNKDYKTEGLNNFYQFCSKIITTPDEPLGSNDNFVGRCENGFLRINIWKPTTEMKIITNDFTTLKLDKENKITIGDKPASEFIYSGLSQILGGVHTWHLFVVQTNDYIYSITGDSCMDNKTECNQIISTFNFTKLISDKEQKSCNNDSDCACGVNIKTRNCFLGNKKYVDTTKQCPDFCGGIAGNLITKCINNLCKQVSFTE